MVVAFVLIFFAEPENATIQWIFTLSLYPFFNRRPKETNISFSGVSRHGPFRLVAKSVNVPFSRDC